MTMYLGTLPGHLGEIELCERCDKDVFGGFCDCICDGCGESIHDCACTANDASQPDGAKP